MSYLIGSSYLLLLIITIIILLSVKKYRESAIKNWKCILIYSVASFLITNVLLFLYLRQEQFIAYWELGGFWRKSLEFNAMMNVNVSEALSSLWQSMQHSEYSYLSQFFLSTITRIIGNSYPRFVLSMFNLFIMPFNILLFSFMLMIIKDKENCRKLTVTLIAVTVSLFAGNLLPMIHGYVGSAALTFILSVVILIYCGVLEKKISPYSIYIGIVMILIVLIRRWYAYTVVGFFLGFGISYLIRWIIEKQNYRKDVIPVYLNLFICGIIPLLILVIVFNDFFKTMTTYDYTFAYSAMSLYSPLEIAKWFVSFYGVIHIILMLIGIYRSVKNPETRYVSLALIIAILFAVIAFNQVQVFGSHHYYIINVFMLYFILCGIIELFSIIKSIVIQKVIISVTSLILIINISYIFLPDKGYQLREVNKWLISSPFPYMRQRDDIDKVREITNFFKHSVGNSSVYVLASSINFSADILQNSLLPNDLNPIENLAPSHVWDTRDGVPKQFFNYQYIVIADPIQYQFAPEEHRVIEVFAEEIMYEGILTPYYNEINEYEITQGIKVKIYKRNSEIPLEVKNEISEIFRSYYPDYPFLYEFD